jgi:hypothetical protein
LADYVISYQSNSDCWSSSSGSSEMGFNCSRFHYNFTVGVSSDWSTNVTFGHVVSERDAGVWQIATGSNSKCQLEDPVQSAHFSMLSFHCSTNSPTINVNSYQLSMFAMLFDGTNKMQR